MYSTRIEGQHPRTLLVFSISESFQFQKGCKESLTDDWDEASRATGRRRKQGFCRMWERALPGAVAAWSNTTYWAGAQLWRSILIRFSFLFLGKLNKCLCLLDKASEWSHLPRISAWIIYMSQHFYSGTVVQSFHTEPLILPKEWVRASSKHTSEPQQHI